MTQTQLTTQVAPAVNHLKVLGISGLTGSKLDLQSADAAWKLSLPRSAFPGCDPQPGETVVVTLTLVRTVVEEVPDAPSGLIMPRVN